jgi:cell division protease FtsH
VNYIIASQASSGPERLQVPYSFFRAEVGEGNVAEVTSTGDTIEGDFKKETAPPKGVDGSPSTHFKTERPAFADDGLIDLLLQKNVVINAHPIDEGQPLWETLLFGFGPTILIVGLFVLLARRAQAAAGVVGWAASAALAPSATTRSRPERSTSGQRGRYRRRPREWLVEVVDFLRNPAATPLPARRPGRCPALGAAGHRRRSCAGRRGRAGVPFFSLSASEFIEAIVGVGASRCATFTRPGAARPSSSSMSSTPSPLPRRWRQPRRPDEREQT